MIFGLTRPRGHTFGCEYGLGRTPEQVHRTFMATAARLDKTPAADGTNGAQFRAFSFPALFNPAAATEDPRRATPCASARVRTSWRR